MPREDGYKNLVPMDQRSKEEARSLGQAGGIASGEDALQFIMAGAAAVQVGTANFADPHACQRITREIDQWMDAHGVNSLDEIRGCARG